MNTVHAAETNASRVSAAARPRLLSLSHEPLFYGDWMRTVFIHYEVDPRLLQPDVPFALDLHEGKAFVSLVAFTMRRMRPCVGGALAEWLFKPLATPQFLNVRTYVRHRREPGIFFLAEWLSNRWSVQLGPRAFGLPYRFGRLNYEHAQERSEVRGQVSDGSGARRLRYTGRLDTGTGFRPSVGGTRDEFLLERYTAFTQHGRMRRFFRIWHPPWPQTPLDVCVDEKSLLTGNWPWFGQGRLVGANYSPGVENVWMGWPHRIREPQSLAHRSRHSAFFELP